MVRPRTALVAALALATAGYLGGSGVLPGTPASAWRSRVEDLEATVALLRGGAMHGEARKNGAVGADGVARAPRARVGGAATSGAGAAVAVPDAVLGAAECGAPTLVVGILTSADARGASLRTVLRETWMRLADPASVTMRFLLSVRPGDVPPADVAAEAKAHGDVLFLPVDPGHRKGYSGSRPSNLLERVQAFMRWATDRCGAFRYVLKTDDDCYVAVDALMSRIDRGDFPRERLYMGRFLGGMPGRDGKGKPDPDNYQNMHEFPKYAGAGYLLTPDVASFVGRPGLPMLYHRVEDRGVGVMLFGFNVTYLNGEEEFQPWGKCTPKSLWIHHFQKDEALMRRRYARAAAGRSVCGDGFPDGVVCAMAEQGKPLKLECPDARPGKPAAIAEVVFASYGKHKTSAPGPCAEGMDALMADAGCHHEGSAAIVEKACLGKEVCDSIVNTVQALGADPCPSEHWDKRFLAVVRCK